jgi:nucleotide-binding universal stress UspA family protein
MSKQLEHLSVPKTILVGVAEGPTSDHAIRAGCALGEKLGARVELVHAVRAPAHELSVVDPGRWPEGDDDARQLAAKHVGDHVRSLGIPALGRSGKGEIRVHIGVAAAVLLESTRTLGADLVVLGAHESRGIVDFGSTARAVLARGTVPVWVQPRPAGEIREILVPTDLSEDSLRALALARDLAVPFGARLRVAYVFDASPLYAITPDALGYVPATAVDQFRESAAAAFEAALARFDWRSVPYAAEFLDGRPTTAVLELAKRVDLVAMGTHGRTGLAAAVLGSVAHAVLRGSEAPVLVVPHPRRRFLL